MRVFDHGKSEGDYLDSQKLDDISYSGEWHVLWYREDLKAKRSDISEATFLVYTTESYKDVISTCRTYPEINLQKEADLALKLEKKQKFFLVS